MQTTHSSSRLQAIDSLRGLVIVLMLLDHVRETFYLHHQVTDPMSITTTEPSLFFTRFAAHFCAPIFVFLTGLSAFLRLQNQNAFDSQSESLKSYLIKRGVFLIALEIVVINFLWSGKIPSPIYYLQVIWVIGICMIVLALVHRLPRKILFAIAIILIAGHNLISGIRIGPEQPGYTLWTILLQRGFLPPPLDFVRISYPLLPWIGIIILGYCSGPLFDKQVQAAQRRYILQRAAAFGILMLILLRSFNIYGEQQAWLAYPEFIHSLMSFLNFQKYPPSLDFTLITLSLGAYVLSIFDKDSSKQSGVTRTLSGFGAAPMFFYLLHLFVLLVLKKVADAVLASNAQEGFRLDHVWQIWFLSAALLPFLYALCRRFAQLKKTGKYTFLSYL